MHVVVLRHRKALVPHLEEWLWGHPAGPHLAELMRIVDLAATGEVSMKAYINMLLGMMNWQVGWGGPGAF